MQPGPMGNLVGVYSSNAERRIRDRQMEIMMFKPSRREFIQKSMAVALGPIAAESALFTPDSRTGRNP